MKTIVINASPRKKWNTAEIMQAAQKGAESVGAETEYINSKVSAIGKMIYLL